MTRAELVSSQGYWTAKIQIDLYHQLEVFMKDNNLNRTQLAERLGVTKGYISQVLNGDFDHKISKLVALALAMGKIPQIDYPDLHEFIAQENRGYTASPFVFKAVIRGDQIQDLTYTSTADDEHNHELKVLNA